MLLFMIRSSFCVLGERYLQTNVQRTQQQSIFTQTIRQMSQPALENAGNINGNLQKKLFVSRFDQSDQLQVKITEKSCFETKHVNWENSKFSVRKNSEDSQ